ncbi:hypothetical protein B0H12DRAFT_1238937 [Mycena haematopus]|nr:hypothetical protein B0H12DRAFT_1238937 [Mycena haematopus]
MTPFSNCNPTFVLGNTPPSGLRPSSAPTRLRAPRTSYLPIEPLDSSALQFRTLATKGRAWDVSPRAPSPLSLPVPLAVDDHDEIEYMPPTVEQEPWAPLEVWAMPDYRELGSALRARAEGGRRRMGTTANADALLALPELDPSLDDPCVIVRTTSSTNAASTAPASKTRRPPATMSANLCRAVHYRADSANDLNTLHAAAATEAALSYTTRESAGIIFVFEDASSGGYSFGPRVGRRLRVPRPRKRKHKHTSNEGCVVSYLSVTADNRRPLTAQTCWMALLVACPA